MMILLLLSLAAADAQAVPATTPPKKPATSPDKIICRSFPETGSLVRMIKVCKTKHDWDVDRENLRAGPGVDSCRNAGNGGPC